MQSRVNRGDEALNGRLSRRQFGRIVVLSVAGVGVLAACAAPAPTPTSPPKPIATTAPAAVPPTAVPARATTAPVAGGTLTVAVRNPICGLDPGKTCGYPSGPAALYLISNRLVRVDSALQLLPDLAESWEVSADKLKWTFRLRKGVKFHDGTPFNSQAVKAHFDHSRDPELAATGSVKFPQVVSIDTPDEHTVVFGTETPFGPFLSYLAVFIRVLMSPAAIQKHGAKALGQNPVGTGPYKVTEFQPNVRLALERNDEYFGGRPPLDKVVIIPAPEASARTNLLRSGQADVIEDVPTEELKDLERNPDISVVRKKSLYVFGVNFNTDLPPFDDVRVRRAFNLAVDKRAMAAAIFGGAASVLDSPLASTIIGYKSIMTYDYSPEKAKALLAEAGWRDTDGDGILDKDGKALRPTYIYNEVLLKAAEVAQAVQGDLKKIGVDLQLRAIDQAAWGPTVLTKRGNLKAELQFTAFNPSDGDATRQLRFMFLTNPDPTGAPFEGNWGWFSDPAIDAPLRAAGVETDQGKRSEKLAEAQKLLMDAAPWIFLYAPDLLVGVRKNVQNVDVFPMSFLDLARASKS